MKPFGLPAKRRPAESAAPANTATTPSMTVEPAPLPEFRIRAFRVGFTATLGVLLALLLGGIVGQLSTVILYVALALFLALGLDPAVSWMQRKGLPRWAAILIVIAVVIGVFVALIAAIVPIVINEGTKIVNDWDRIAFNLQHNDFVTWINDITGGDAVDQTIKAIGDWVSNPANIGSLGGGILAVGAGIAGGFTGAIIVLILTLYFLASLRGMRRASARFVPASSRRGYLDVAGDITDAVGRYVMGQVTLGAVNGVLSLFYLSIIGAPAPILLAFIAFLCSLVPLVGTLTGAIIISLVCLTASPVTALAAAIYYLIYMQVEAYVISPRIMNRAVAVPGALVVIAAVAGGTLGGVLGALVAIPVAASLIIILEKVVFPKLDAR